MPKITSNPIFIAATLLGLLLLSGCISFLCCRPSLQSQSCPIESLLIEKSDLPTAKTHWPEGTIGEPPSRVLADKVDIMFSTASMGGVIHAIYNFWYLDDAVKYYENDVTGWFSKTKFETEWITPDDLMNFTVKADTHDLRCSNSLYSGSETCLYFARYQNYVIELKADIIAVNYDQFIQIIQKIDQNMNNCFEKR